MTDDELGAMADEADVAHKESKTANIKNAEAMTTATPVDEVQALLGNIAGTLLPDKEAVIQAVKKSTGRPLNELRAYLKAAEVENHPPSNITEDSAADSFCKANPNLRYVARWGQWFSWNGSRWVEDDTLAVYDKIRGHAREEKLKQFLRAQSIAGIEKLTKADRRYAATTDQWDTDDWLLNTPEGIADLKTGQSEKHDPKKFLTKITTATPEGDCPTWLKLLKDWTGGNDAYVKFLQRVCGYALTGSTKEHALFFFYGTGGNGKGTFLNTVKEIAGDYASVAAVETFTDSKTERHPTDLAMLRGARIVLAQETESDRAWAESKIKSLTGGDPVTARFMRQDFFTYLPKFKLLVAGNHKPRLKNVDDAIKRRLHLLPFTKSFTKNPDRDLPEKLKAEAGGILQWMIDGCLDYQKQGLKPPKVVLDATAEYFAAENIFEQWLQDACTRSPKLYDSPTKLFESWRDYAEASNERAGNMNQMAERLDAAGFKSGNSRKKGRHWTGLKLKPWGEAVED